VPMMDQTKGDLGGTKFKQPSQVKKRALGILRGKRAFLTWDPKNPAQRFQLLCGGGGVARGEQGDREKTTCLGGKKGTGNFDANHSHRPCDSRKSSNQFWQGNG